MNTEKICYCTVCGDSFAAPYFCRNHIVNSHQVVNPNDAIGFRDGVAEGKDFVSGGGLLILALIVAIGFFLFACSVDTYDTLGKVFPHMSKKKRAKIATGMIAGVAVVGNKIGKTVTKG